ncbi:hypothetical protein QR680_015525 [Steinernema hermaphroditum]|uniref:7TM GPCR serpentine receptor class x (Srx) domain-containing protein n=1 Tax=Steinernema hermaphroditum TaxID=289476 RepID=A0AA39H815_9BILA|nr:hypothetical protein QR680_015525 [Steinernema hermaphroditum]
MNTTMFVYGSELQGRGHVTTTDLQFGSLTTIIGIVAFIGGLLNLYLIKKLKMFHSAFGFFWGARTAGELGIDFVYLAYTGPVTILQVANIPARIGIFFYHFGFAFTYIQCVMHWAIALNRLVAVWLPLRYGRIFNKKLCITVVVFICVKAIAIVALFIVFPCNHLGYSPRFHANVFVKCSPYLNRDYSLIAPILYKVCFSVLCSGTGIINFVTFTKIAYIRITSKAAYNQRDFKRDVRLFTVGVVQDVVMVGIVAYTVYVNNAQNISDTGILVSYDGLVFINIVNTISMVFFNPECRRSLFQTATKISSISGTVEPGQSATAAERST